MADLLASSRTHGQEDLRSSALSAQGVKGATKRKVIIARRRRALHEEEHYAVI